MAYLDKNTPRRSQFRDRRGKPTGTIVVHSAENLQDVKPPDTGAENVAEFIRDRSDAGAYHWLADSDSGILLVEFEKAAYGDGTGSNDWAIHISGAFQAHQWRSIPKWWRDGCVRKMAVGARHAADWLLSEHGIIVPPRRLRKSNYNHPGFCSHKDREDWFGEPGRRSDPGAWFPWDQFFYEYIQLGTNMEDDMSAFIELIESAYKYHRGKAYNPRNTDHTGWAYWMERLATQTDIHGEKADGMTIVRNCRDLLKLHG